MFVQKFAFPLFFSSNLFSNLIIQLVIKSKPSSSQEKKVLDTPKKNPQTSQFTTPRKVTFLSLSALIIF